MKRSIKSLSLIASACCIVLSCVNDVGIIEGNTAERVKKSLVVLGYGFENGASSSGTELAARQYAIASLAEQVKGAYFEYSRKAGKAEFYVGTSVDVSGMREYYKKTERLSGKYYSSYLMGAEVEIEYPRPYGVFVKSYRDAGSSVSEILVFMKARAVKDCVNDKFGGSPPAIVKGRLYVTGLDVAIEGDGTSASVNATFSLVFDSATR